MHRPHLFFLLLWLSLGLLACRTQPQSNSTTQLNGLANSSSPYLLQHAENPVNWQPWGEAALGQAEQDQKLIIISIGYAACHWCHVMEHESFEDSSVARVMNDHFVSIKVDREQRPDVDQVYMNAALLTTGRGGWPLNALALPDGRPFFATTYLPKENWMQLLQQFVQLYQQQPEQLDRMATRLTQGIQQMDYAELNPEEAAFTPELFDQAVQTLLDQMDAEHGGLRGAPKFPLPTVLDLVLRHHQLTGDQASLSTVQTALDRIWRGGIYDHVGGGFARYSVDSIWHVPHFEKMLYDNAQLVTLYSRAHRVTKDPHYEQVVRETLDFVERELTDSLGAFYTSLDADSEGEEGRYYTWKEKDITKAVGMDAMIFKDYYSISPFGNWAERREDKLNILHITDPAEEVAARYDLSASDFQALLQRGKAKLMEKREKRVRPALDDKVLTGWNALMIRAYAEAYRTWGDSSYLAAALRNAAFIEEHMQTADGELFRSWRMGQGEVSAFASDYGLLIDAYLALYEASFDPQWLGKADAYMQQCLTRFFDDSTGMFYFTAHDADQLISRGREVSDNVIPAANSVLARDLFYLGQYLYQPSYQAKARQMLNNVVINLAEGGVSTANWSILLSHLAHPFYEVAIVGTDWASKRAALDQQYHPNVLYLGGEEAGDMKLLQNKAVPGKTLIYVCRDKACQLPTDEVRVAQEQLTP